MSDPGAGPSDEATGMAFVRELREDRTLVARLDSARKGQTWYLRAKPNGQRGFTRAVLFRAREPVVRLTDLGPRTVATLCASHDVAFADIDECRDYFERPDFDRTGCGIAEVLRGP